MWQQKLYSVNEERKKMIYHPCLHWAPALREFQKATKFW